MRDIRNKYIYIAILLLAQCKPPVTFDQPQPSYARALTSFPERVQGTYLSRDKISVLIINNSAAIRTYSYDVVLHKDSLKSSYKLQDDTLINMATGEKQTAIVAGDSIYSKSAGADTLFYISATGVLKKFKGYYFLNSLYDQNAWTLQRLSLSNGVLTLSGIEDSVHINQLKEITETPADTIRSNFKLNRKQFKKLLNSDGFDKSEQFVKIK